MSAARFLVSSYKNIIGSVEEKYLVVQPVFLEVSDALVKLKEKLSPSDIGDDSDIVDDLIRFYAYLGELRDKLRRNIVDAVISDIFEDIYYARFSRTRKSRYYEKFHFPYSSLSEIMIGSHSSL